ncbi:PadR family transcriptional regulator [Amycolatopsis decaplanina]|uniref:Transcriptional regulator, PadR family protein n=1 Tax=Amycolatopsis decaplanina DSM 44594 TaxID=1284240 RepID=M2X921_9PSEU|nr:PadR family transcriptional regulator [Amycolatopsis decaplanina]EME57596.1 Transcriptional regulator, PadR family protein [Amycolatopsis decaplanina DSM 44594]
MAAKLTPLAMAVLELLHERPMHPYEMAQLMRERFVSARVKVKAGSLYHTVDRLVRNGFVEVVETQRDGKRPERTVYAMTEAGRDEFVDRAQDMLATPAEEYPEYLSALAVIDELGPEMSLTHLKHRVLRLQAAIASDQVVLENLVDEHKLPEIYWLEWSYATARRAFELEWTQKLVEDLESGRIRFQGHCTPHLNLVTEDDSDERKTS